MDGDEKYIKYISNEIERLKEENLKFRNLIENSKDIIYRMSIPDGSYEFINSACMEITGFSTNEFYENPLLIKKIIHPDFKDYFFEKWGNILEGKIDPFFEFKLIDKSGNTKWIFQKNVLITDDNGKPKAIEGIASDITARRSVETALKRSEARLLEAQEMAHIGNWFWDVNSGDVQWSDEVYKIFRLNKEEFIPKIDSILSLSPWPEESERDRELIQKAVESKEKGSYEQRFLLPDGSTGFYFSSFEGEYNAEGKLTAIKGTVQDITERKIAEEERKILEEQYRQSQKVESIGRLAGGVAHDLNNMLTPILGYCEMLLDLFSLEGKKKEYVCEIMDAGERAKNLVSQLLAFSRKQTFEYRTMDIEDVIRGLEKFLRHTIMENIEIKVDFSGEPKTVRADKNQIEQVVINLVVNAQDAIDKNGEITIETGIVRFEEDFVIENYAIEKGEYVMLAISDNGCGMDKATKDQIFDPFFSTKGEMGTGLGLATVYGIVKQHGGNIYVHSEIDKGTTFRIYLPYHNDHSIGYDLPTEKTAHFEGSETILLAEDDKHVRNLTRSVLQKYGYKVIEAKNGEEAIEAAKHMEEPPALLLTDVVMPGMNGKDLFEQISQIFPKTKVVYFSGYTNNIIARHGILDEGIQFIQKPFSTEELVSKIRKVLDR